VNLNIKNKKMSVEAKIEQAKQQIAQKEADKGLKKRKLTWREKFGTFPVLWLYGWGLLAGIAWTYVALTAPQMFEARTIVIVNPAQAKEIEKPEEKVEVIHKDEVAELAEMIYNLESTNGKNNYSKCEAIGKINGIGYGIPGNGKYQCFESHEDEMQVLKGWIIDKKSKGMTEKELLCLYSGNNYDICK